MTGKGTKNVNGVWMIDPEPPMSEKTNAEFIAEWGVLVEKMLRPEPAYDLVSANHYRIQGFVLLREAIERLKRATQIIEARYTDCEPLETEYDDKYPAPELDWKIIMEPSEWVTPDEMMELMRARIKHAKDKEGGS